MVYCSSSLASGNLKLNLFVYQPLKYTQSKISVLRGISKPLQRLPRYTGLWAGWGLGHMLQSWGRFFLCPWHYVCQFSAKNIIGHDLWNVSKKVTTSIEVKIAIKTLRHSPARIQRDFLPRIGIRNVKDIRKNVPNFETCDPTPTPPTTLYI